MQENLTNQTDKCEFISRLEMQKSWEKYTENQTPDATVIEITNKCPNNCAHCYANIAIGKNNTNMTPETFNNWVDIISSSERKPEQIWLVGGEPTSHPLLNKFLKDTREYGFQPMIVTTGESFANIDYCREIAPLADEIDITIRGFGAFHDLMMLPSDSEIFKLIPNNISPQEQLDYIIELSEQDPDSADHFNKTIEGLINIAQVTKETGSDTKIGLNIDIQATTNLSQIIRYLNSKNIPISNVILQIQTFSDENNKLENIIPNTWRKPNAKTIEEYYKQAQELIANNEYTGHIEIIDQISPEILDQIKADGIDLEDFYNPAETPAIGPNGKLRQNVVKETGVY